MKKIIQVKSEMKPIGPYSLAVEANGMLFISGMISFDMIEGKLVEGDIRVQTRQVLKNIGELLKTAGCDYKDVVKSTCLLSDMDNFAAMNEVYAEYYPVDPPARAAYGVVRLPYGVLIEIETIAVKS